MKDCFYINNWSQTLCCYFPSLFTNFISQFLPTPSEEGLIRVKVHRWAVLGHQRGRCVFFRHRNSARHAGWRVRTHTVHLRKEEDLKAKYDTVLADIQLWKKLMRQTPKLPPRSANCLAEGAVFGSCLFARVRWQWDLHNKTRHCWVCQTPWPRPFNNHNPSQT